MSEEERDGGDLRQLLLEKLESLRTQAMNRKAEEGLTDYYSGYESFNEANSLMRDFCKEKGYDISLIGDELDPPGNWRAPI